jgi:pimeloyl-ACP methyl ester carboxylesterase
VDLQTGISMAYVEVGDPSGEPTIFLHGFTDTSRSFWPTIGHLAGLRPDLRIFALDQRGHGDSSMPDPEACQAAPERCFRPADFAADVLAFMDAKGIDRAHIVGHSLGSLIAQELALETPERVRRMVLIATSARTADQPAVGEFLLAGLIEGPWRDALLGRGIPFPDGAYELTPLDADPDIETWMIENWVVEVTADPAFLASILPETVRTPLGTWVGVARALTSVDNTERLKTLSVPVLVIWPTQDVTFLASDQRELRAALDTAARACKTRYFFKEYGRKPLPETGLQEDDLGHNVQWGAPEMVARDLVAYLRDGGEPTPDLPHPDPDDVRRIVTAPGEARIHVGVGDGCPSR